MKNTKALKLLAITLGAAILVVLTTVFASAKRMLQTTEHTVEYISYDCGFTSPSSFIRAFKRIVGMPPTEFRQTEI